MILLRNRSAGKVLGNAKLLGTVRRFERFLDNEAIEVRAWYEPIAKQWIKAQWQHFREIRLIVDGTKVGLGHQLLMVSLAYRRRSIPVAWAWIKQVRGHTKRRWVSSAFLFSIRQIQVTQLSPRR